MQPHRSSATLLAVVFALLIAYASLYPFADWRDQGIGPFAFFTAPWPRYWSHFDVVANFLGYAPLGFLATLALVRTTLLPQPVVWVTLAAATLSLLLEALQTYLPTRVPAVSDLLLNSAGACTGGVLAMSAQRLGVVDRWSSLRRSWFVREARAPLVLLVLWPLALLFPPAAPLSLGQVRERLQSSVDALLEGTPLAHMLHVPGDLHVLSSLGEMICVACGFLALCWLGFSVTLGWHRRLLLLVGALWLGVAASSLSASMSYSPEHAWSWLSGPTQLGLLAGLLLALLSLNAPRRLCLALLVVALVWQLSLINTVPSTPYYAQTLQAWEQGRFIRFHGLAQWLGWLWPFATLWVALLSLSQAERRSG
jgi:VanZ family protein